MKHTNTYIRGGVLVPISLFGESVEGGRERCIDREAETCITR